MEPKSFCQIFFIWTVLFFTSLMPNVSLATFDIFSDSYLTIEYYEQMQNDTYNMEHNRTCYELREHNPPCLDAFASCLNSEAKFNYTIAFLLLPLAFYLTEFLMLRPEYEPTGLRQRIIVSFKNFNSMLNQLQP